MLFSPNLAALSRGLCSSAAALELSRGESGRQVGTLAAASCLLCLRESQRNNICGFLGSQMVLFSLLMVIAWAVTDTGLLSTVGTRAQKPSCWVLELTSPGVHSVQRSRGLPRSRMGGSPGLMERWPSPVPLLVLVHCSA